MHLFYSRRSFGPLFKYATREWATRLAREGDVRVSTLSDFRRAEAHDAERGDAGEGTRVLTSDLGRTYTKQEDIPDFIGRGIELEDGGTIEFVGPHGFSSNREHADVYIYSVTERFDKQVMKRFGGACVRISDSLGFFCAMDERLRSWLPGARSLVADGVLDRCTYADRSQHYKQVEPCEDYFLKARGYAHQQEVRAAWTPVRRPLEPLAFRCPALTQFCELYA